jgi:hypothetical protein
MHKTPTTELLISCFANRSPGPAVLILHEISGDPDRNSATTLGQAVKQALRMRRTITTNLPWEAITQSIGCVLPLQRTYVH